MSDATKAIANDLRRQLSKCTDMATYKLIEAAANALDFKPIRTVEDVIEMHGLWGGEVAQWDLEIDWSSSIHELRMTIFPKKTEVKP